jgi:ketosteroid isomerase-like protein
MNRLFTLPVLIGTLLLVTTAEAAVPAYLGRYQSTPEDVAAIRQLTQDFHDALVAKNARQLSTLVFNSNILFASPASPEKVKTINDKQDVNFDGVAPGGFERFAEFVGTAPGAMEERFYDMKVVQDGHLGWVSFDFEFLQEGKVTNYGLETWVVLKTQGDKWKILSNIWSSHGAPKVGR